MFINEGTADRSNKMNEEVYGTIQSAHIYTNVTQEIGSSFRVQMKDDLEHQQDFWKNI